MKIQSACEERATEWTGDCQCGAVRYQLLTPPACEHLPLSYVPESIGQPFMAFARIRYKDLPWMRTLAVMFIALIYVLPGAAAAETREAPEAAIRTALEKWTAEFNAGNAGQICDLFAFELRYDYRGRPERNYRDICGLLQRSLEDRTKSYAYALEIKEILVSGELAVVRLAWTLRIRSNHAPESAKSVEPGMDIFRKQADGSWKIIRYIAYEE